MNRLKSSLPFSKSSSTSTPPPEESDRARASELDEGNAFISQRRQLFESLYSTFTSYYKSLSKERTDPRNEGSISLSSLKRGGEKEKELPIKWFGHALLEGAELVGDDDQQYSELSHH